MAEIKLMYKIAVVDDHTILLDGLRWVVSQLDFVQSVDAYSDPNALLLDLKKGKAVDLVVTDLQMPEMSGHELIEQLKKDYPAVKIMVMTMFDSPFVLNKVVNSKADGYFVKNGDGSQLANAMLTILDGGSYFPEEIADMHTDGNWSGAELTKRETEILNLIATEKSSKMIAETLFISEDTVLTHRKNIMQKLRIHSVAGLVNFALKNNIA